MEERCENCKHYCEFRMYLRRVETIGGMGYVSGWTVGVNKMKESSTHGCTLFLKTDNVVSEVDPHDRCEMFKPKE